MQTKVAAAAGEELSLARRRAAVLKLLIAAQRDRGVTLQSVASEVGTQRSNLSAYIGSHGERRCIALERLREALYALGAHWDFILRGRQYHRWDLGHDLQLVPGLQAILEANRVSRFRVMPTVGREEAFVAIEAAGEAICLLRVQKTLFDAVCGCFGISPEQPVVEASVSDAVQSAWLAKEAPDAMAAVLGLLDGNAMPTGEVRGLAEGRRVATV